MRRTGEGHVLDHDDKAECINAIEVERGWERVRIRIASGAIDAVAPKAVDRRLPVR